MNWWLKCLCSLVILVSCDSADKAKKLKDGDEIVNKDTRTKRFPNKESGGKRKEIRKAIETALETPDTADRDMALAEIIQNVFETHPEIAMETLDYLSYNGPERAITVRKLSGKMVAKGEDEAIAWMNSLKSPEDIEIAREQIAITISLTDPAQAASLTLGTSAGDEPNRATMKIIQTWVGVEPAAAAEWVQKLPKGAKQKEIMKTVARQWLQSDSKTAFLWISNIRDQRLKYEATRAVAEALAGTPAPIKPLILEIAEPELRAQIEQEVKQVENETDGIVPNAESR